MPSPNYQLIGRISTIFPEREIGARGFSIKEFVVETDEKYPQPVKIQVPKDKISLLEGFKEGDEVAVSFNVKGKEHKGNFFVNLSAWRIDHLDGSSPSKEPVPAGATASSYDEDDDMPF